MKKNLFYVFALICSMSLFTACSDDEEPNWKKLPTQEISTENLTLTTNSQGTLDASVKLTMSDAQNGVLTLNNAIRGLNEVEINVTVEEQNDGAFKFQGVKVVETKTRAISDLVSSTTVKVAGTITLEGKAEVAVTTEAAGNLVRKWLLCDDIFTVKEVPGVSHSPFRLSWVSTYGEKDNVGLATENISLIGSTSLSSIFVKLLKDVEFKADGSIVANYAESVGEISMEEVLKGAMGAGLPSTENVPWTTSPANLAYWYAGDNHIYVVLNIPAIISEAMKDQEDANVTPESILKILDMVKDMKGAEIKDLLGGFLKGNELLSKLDITKISDTDVEKLIGYVVNGFPVSYQMSEVTLKNETKINNVYVYLDKSLFDIFMPAVYPILPELDVLVKNIEVEMYGQKMKIWDLLGALTALQSLTELEGIWKATSQFNIGIDLATGSYKTK